MTNQYVSKVVSDLEVKAMLFDMDIEWETLSLQPFSKNKLQRWQQQYRQKRQNADFDEYFDVDRSDDEYRG